MYPSLSRVGARAPLPLLTAKHYSREKSRPCFDLLVVDVVGLAVVPLAVVVVVAMLFVFACADRILLLSGSRRSPYSFLLLLYPSPSSSIPSTCSN